MTLNVSMPARLAVAAPLVAVIPLLASLPGTGQDSNVTRAVTLTSTVDVSGAEGFLFNPTDYSPVNMMTNGIIPTAYGLLSTMYSDSGDEFYKSLPPMTALNFGLVTDLLQIGQLNADAVHNATNFLTTAGDFTPATGPTADVDVVTNTTTQQDFIGIIHEGTIATASLDNLHLLPNADATGIAGTLWGFQQDINGAINGLNHALTPDALDAYAPNSFLGEMLHGLLVSELNLNSLTGDAATELAAGNDVGLAGTDAAMIVNALGEFGYTQGALGFFEVQNALGDAGSWLSSI